MTRYGDAIDIFEKHFDEIEKWRHITFSIFGAAFHRAVAWRAASLDAMAELAGLVESRELGSTPVFVHEAFRKIQGGEGVQAEEPAAAAEDECAELTLRSDGDYRRLALQILNSQAFKTMPANSGRKKNRVIGRLMNRALSGG